MIDSWGDKNYHDIAVNVSGPLEVQNSVVRNSGDNAIYNTSDSLRITGTNIYNNQTGLSNASGKPVISGSRIYSNATFGINNVSQDTVDARNNYWGNATGPKLFY